MSKKELVCSVLGFLTGMGIAFVWIALWNYLRKLGERRDAVRDAEILVGFRKRGGSRRYYLTTDKRSER